MVDCTAAMATRRNTARAAALLLGLVALTAAVVEPAQAGGKSVALLGVHLQNDNEMYEPTSDAERARMVTVAEIFKHQLSASERYSIVEVPPDVQSKIAAGRTMGECGGCEIEYGQSLGSEIVAWITVQKISNLILKMNVYMADVQAKKFLFVRSVDLRGNTDESWTRSIRYLIKNYLLAPSN